MAVSNGTILGFVIVTLIFVLVMTGFIIYIYYYIDGYIKKIDDGIEQVKSKTSEMINTFKTRIRIPERPGFEWSPEWGDWRPEIPEIPKPEFPEIPEIPKPELPELPEFPRPNPGDGLREKDAEHKDIVALDAAIVGDYLYALREDGKIVGTPLFKRTAAACPIQTPPSKPLSLDVFKGRLIVRGEDKRIYVLEPCQKQCNRGGCKRVADWKVFSMSKTAFENDNIEYVSVSPLGDQLWVQNDTYGQWLDDEDQSIDNVLMGAPDVRRYIGENGDYVDVKDGIAIRNMDLGTKIDHVERILYVPRDDIYVPIRTSMDKKSLQGKIVAFPTRVGDICERLS